MVLPCAGSNANETVSGEMSGWRCWRIAGFTGYTHQWRAFKEYADIAYSVDSITTRGGSGLMPEEGWRMMGALEAADGMLLLWHQHGFYLLDDAIVRAADPSRLNAGCGHHPFG